MLPVQLPEDFCEDERCNVLLTAMEEFHLNAWIRLRDDVRLEITYRPENHPSLVLQLVTVSDEELAAHIKKTCGGMFIRRLNVGASTAGIPTVDGCIAESDDG